MNFKKIFLSAILPLLIGGSVFALISPNIWWLSDIYPAADGGFMMVQSWIDQWKMSIETLGTYFGWGGWGENIYNTDWILTGDRIVNLDWFGMAFGNWAVADWDSSFAVWINAVASWDYGVAIWINTKAYSRFWQVFWANSEVHWRAAVAIWEDNDIRSDYGVSLWDNNIVNASAGNAFAIGSTNVVSGSLWWAIWRWLTKSNARQIVMWTYNIWTRTDTIFEYWVWTYSSHKNLIEMTLGWVEILGTAEYSSTWDMWTNDEAFASKYYVDNIITGASGIFTGLDGSTLTIVSWLIVTITP